MILTSPAFKNNESIPAKYTCQGEEVSPPLAIEYIPNKTRTLALIMDDPDAQMGTWVHWVVFNMPVTEKIDENTIPGKLGTNDSNHDGAYVGPCPPSGTHRYFFKLYALDTEFNLRDGITKQQLEEAMEGHILEKSELVGLYKKQ